MIYIETTWKDGRILHTKIDRPNIAEELPLATEGLRRFSLHPDFVSGRLYDNTTEDFKQAEKIVEEYQKLVGYK